MWSITIDTTSGYWSKLVTNSWGMGRRPPTTVGTRNLVSMDYHVPCLRDLTFSHFDTIPSYDKQTHRHTHTHTDIQRRLIPALWVKTSSVYPMTRPLNAFLTVNASYCLVILLNTRPKPPTINREGQSSEVSFFASFRDRAYRN